MRQSPLFILLLTATLGLSACRTMPETTISETPPTAPAIATVAADDNLNAVLWMQRSAEYRAATETVYRAASDRLDTALKDPAWDALVPGERSTPARGLPPAIVMDLDETVLDNSPYQARLVREGKSYNEATWDAWVREEKARAVPGVVDFARGAVGRARSAPGIATKRS